MRCLLLLLFLYSTLFSSPPKAIVFDYGGVVAKVDRKPVLLFLSESLGRNYRKIKKDFSSERLYKAFNQPKSFWEGYGRCSLDQDWVETLEHHKKAMVQEIPGMRELIVQLKNQGIQIVLLSNTNAHRARFIESMGGYDLFDPILLSCHLKVKKPDAQVYQHLLQSLIWDACDIVFIDNQKINVEVSKLYNIDGILFESVEQLKEELQKREINFL